MYWTNFWQPTVHVQQNICEKTLIEVGRAHLYASFGTFCVQIGQLFESQWDFKLSIELKIDLIFLQKEQFYRFQTFSNDSQGLQRLTNLDVKGAKRSAQMWATKFFESFFKNILLHMNGRRSNIRSVDTGRFLFMRLSVYSTFIVSNI